MDIFAARLRTRISQLGLTIAEAARLCGFDERRFQHYTADRREPDLASLVHIASALTTTPNWLLGLSEEGTAVTARSDLLARVLQSSQLLPDELLQVLAVQAEATARAFGNKPVAGNNST